MSSIKVYLDNIYNVLVSPKEAFETLKETTVMPVAVFTIIWTNLFLFIAKNTYKSGITGDIKFSASLILFFIGIFLVWFFAGIFFEFIAKIFGRAGKLRTLLTLTSYCTVPYLFFPAFELMKRYSDIGYFLGTKFQLLLFVWVMFLYAHSLKKTYDLKFSCSFMLIFLPVVSFFFAFIWIIGTCLNLSYIYSV